MSDNPLGKSPVANATRDAVHVAIIPLIAGEDLPLNSEITLNDKGEAIRSTNIDTRRDCLYYLCKKWTKGIC